MAEKRNDSEVSARTSAPHITTDRDPESGFAQQK